MSPMPAHMITREVSNELGLARDPDPGHDVVHGLTGSVVADERQNGEQQPHSRSVADLGLTLFSPAVS
jgi:hypothetical protein